MIVRVCKVCRDEFPAHKNFKCCSPKCSKINRQRRMKNWNEAHPERVAAFRERFNKRLAA